ncbi:hypothetical protein ABZX66_29015 [Micromonospora aurantiaca]
MRAMPRAHPAPSIMKLAVVDARFVAANFMIDSLGAVGAVGLVL